MQIELSNGGYVMIDDEDYELVSRRTWRRLPVEDGQVYAVATVWAKDKNDSRPLLMHRLIMGAKKGQQIDHVDRDGLNNCRSNLRFVSNAQNAYNSKKRINSRSIYKGVSLTSSGSLWRARVHVDGKETFLGNYESEEDAAKAYDEAAMKYYGQFARINFND